MASPIAALVVRVLADVSEMKESVKGMVASMDDMKATVGRGAEAMGMLSAAVIRFAGPAVIGAAVRAAIDYGSRMTDLSAKTGIAVQQLGKLEFAATQSGGSLEQVTDAISQMQKRLAGGSDSTLEALKQLHIRLTDIIKLTPDEQFRTLARAIADVQDPAMQAKLAMDLFGRSGAALLPTIKALAQGVGDDIATMGDQTAQTLDYLGDQWDRLVGRMKLAVANVTALTAEAFFAVKDFVVNNSGMLAIMGTGAAPGLPGSPGLATNAPLGALGVPENPWKGMADDLEQVNQKLREQQRIRRELALTPDGLLSTRAIGGRIGSLVPGLSGVSLGDLDSMIGSQGLDPGTFGMGGMELFSRSFGPGSWVLPKGGTGLPTGGGFFGSLFGGLKESGQGFLQGLTGGKGMTGLFSNLGTGLLTGGMSSLLGAGVGLVGKGVSKLWGSLTNREERQVNDQRDAFQSTFGGFDEMAAAAQRAGYQIEKLLDTKKVKDFEREMQALKDAIAFQDEAMQTLDETTKKYGFTLDELGPAFARQQLDKQAQELWKDFQVLTAAGIDVDTVITRMGDSINEFVQNALATGTEVPAAMAPMLQRMVEMGALVDENGNVITDLEQAGVKFAMTMSEGFTRLIGEVGRLTDAIARGLGLAIQNVPDIDVGVNYDDPGLPSREVPELPGFASGTGGRFIDFGAGTPVMLHGRERVMTEREALSGDAAVDLLGEFQALRSYLQNDFARDVGRQARWARQVV